MPITATERNIAIGSVGSLLLIGVAFTLLNKRRRLVWIVKADLRRLGGIKETDNRLVPFLRAAWASVGRTFGVNVSSATAWSAATISLWMQRSGAKDFPKSAAHATYIVEARKQRLFGRKAGEGRLELFRLNEIKPRVGDLICSWRNVPRTFDSIQEGDATHCDVVIDTKKDHLIAVGGNVSNSIKATRFETNRKGFVLPQKQVFAIIINRAVL